MKPGYKQTEIGVIPEDWEVTSIIDCCDYADYRGKTPPKTQSGTFLVTARNVRKGFIDYVDSQEYVPSALYDQIMRRGKPRIGDVLITTEAPLGNVAQIDREDVALAQRIIKYRPKIDDLSSTYLKHYFLSDRFQQILDDHSSGSTAKGIKGGVLHKLPVALPPLPEQRAIASALSDVDGLLGALDRLIAKKRDLKQAAMQQLLTGQTRLPGFHGEWVTKKLGELFEITSSKRVFQSEWKSEGIPFYRARELAVLGETGRVDNELFVSRALYDSFRTAHGVPEVGDMLVTGVGTLGKVYVVRNEEEFYFKDGNIIWFKIRGSVSAEFLRQLYLTNVVMKQITDGSAGTTVGTYTISGAKKTEIPVPPLHEQTAIAGVLSDMDAELAALEERREKTRALKQGMMQELLTGRIRLG
ncbi:MAG: hypothetical protein RLZZ399_660 [Verrucomicrobiota bacterium]|jgi:type I restriction enzyme S subunit